MSIWVFYANRQILIIFLKKPRGCGISEPKDCQRIFRFSFSSKQVISVLTKISENSTILTEHFLPNSCHALSQFRVIELNLSDQELMYCSRKATDPKLHKNKESKVHRMKNYTSEQFVERS